jgi:hypothetical protein
MQSDMAAKVCYDELCPQGRIAASIEPARYVTRVRLLFGPTAFPAGTTFIHLIHPLRLLVFPALHFVRCRARTDVATTVLSSKRHATRLRCKVHKWSLFC